MFAGSIRLFNGTLAYRKLWPGATFQIGPVCRDLMELRWMVGIGVVRLASNKPPRDDRRVEANALARFFAW